MKLRSYKSVSDVNSRTDGTGVTFAHEIFGENTRVNVMDRLQKPANYNGKHWNQLLFSITFDDFNYGMVIKAMDTHAYEKMYVEYGGDLYEQPSMEEFYKICLLIAKVHLQRTVKGMKELHRKFLAGEHSYPLGKSNVNEYLRRIENEEKLIATIDIEDADLIYLKQYQK